MVKLTNLDSGPWTLPVYPWLGHLASHLTSPVNESGGLMLQHESHDSEGSWEDDWEDEKKNFSITRLKSF